MPLCLSTYHFPYLSLSFLLRERKDRDWRWWFSTNVTCFRWVLPFITSFSLFSFCLFSSVSLSISLFYLMCFSSYLCLCLPLSLSLFCLSLSLSLKLNFRIFSVKMNLEWLDQHKMHLIIFWHVSCLFQTLDPAFEAPPPASSDNAHSGKCPLELEKIPSSTPIYRLWNLEKFRDFALYRALWNIFLLARNMKEYEGICGKYEEI